MSGWYCQYTGQSIGRLMHFMYVYGSLDIASLSLFGMNTITFHGEHVVSNIKFERIEVEGLNGWKFVSEDVPVFEFTSKFSWMADEQVRRQRAAILESAPYEAKKRVDAIKSEMRNYKLTIAIFSDDGKATWDWKSEPKVIQAERALQYLTIRLEQAEKEAAEAEEHEFDFARI